MAKTENHVHIPEKARMSEQAIEALQNVPADLPFSVGDEDIGDGFLESTVNFSISDGENNFEFGSALVTEEVEFSPNGDFLTVDVTDNQIIFSSSFEGDIGVSSLYFIFSSDNVDTIKDVGISTNIDGLDKSDIKFDDNSISVDISNTVFAPGSNFTLTADFIV